MINFDENKMIDNGLFIYEARNQLEAIASRRFTSNDGTFCRYD